MARIRDFKETILTRVQADPQFGDALLEEGIETMLCVDVEAGNAILRDCGKATVGFRQLRPATGASPKSLIRVSGPTGNAPARNRFAVISRPQRHAGLTLRATAPAH